jgi:hypothetical protein
MVKKYLWFMKRNFLLKIIREKYTLNDKNDSLITMSCCKDTIKWSNWLKYIKYTNVFCKANDFSET